MKEKVSLGTRTSIFQVLCWQALERFLWEVGCVFLGKADRRGARSRATPTFSRFASITLLCHGCNFVNSLADSVCLGIAGRDHTGIMGHSMGGHGAITIALKNPDKYKSLSAFAPICNPINCPWGMPWWPQGIKTGSKRRATRVPPRVSLDDS